MWNPTFAGMAICTTETVVLLLTPNGKLGLTTHVAVDTQRGTGGVRTQKTEKSGKRACKGAKFRYSIRVCRGRSSVVERHVANVNVVGSSPIARCSWCGKAGIGLAFRRSEPI